MGETVAKRRRGELLVAVLAALLFALVAAMLSAKPAKAEKVYVADKTVTVYEKYGRTDTGLTIENGDYLEITPGPEKIWSGVALTGSNGPEGWADRPTTERKFPLNNSPLNRETCWNVFDWSYWKCSSPYSLIGSEQRFRYWGWGQPTPVYSQFELKNWYSAPVKAGETYYGSMNTGTPYRLHLEINDDAPGNGSGYFTARVKVYRYQ
jgi:hypothetical protein